MTESEPPPLSPQDEAALLSRLANTPSPSIPPAVSQLVAAAIDAESQARAEREGANVVGISRGRRGFRILAAVASVAVIALVGVAVLPTLTESNSDFAAQSLKACTVAAEPSADLTPVMHESGERYAMGDFSDQAMGVMSEPAPECDQTADQDPATGAPEAEEPGIMAAKMPELRSCVVAEMVGRPIHFADMADFEGKPAVVVVAGAPEEVVALDCGGGQPAVLARKTMAD